MEAHVGSARRCRDATRQCIDAGEEGTATVDYTLRTAALDFPSAPGKPKAPAGCQGGACCGGANMVAG